MFLALGGRAQADDCFGGLADISSIFILSCVLSGKGGGFPYVEVVPLNVSVIMVSGSSFQFDFCYCKTMRLLRDKEDACWD